MHACGCLFVVREGMHPEGAQELVERAVLDEARQGVGGLGQGKINLINTRIRPCAGHLAP